ncbi:ATP-dependent DNA helicase [Mycena indigotica]|uniref:ATP-dependent DNA helicase n=1 Tax=Mycena indigotica TaxID=2126181 RepID=A0A8H6SWJ3_9AGAR|nr:ATP-dependent DNA helicase [Mycena indigotica]KAF7307535.1 ATP-dependent DNA helicase [Mycena indigotica]
MSLGEHHQWGRVRTQLGCLQPGQLVLRVDNELWFTDTAPLETATCFASGLDHYNLEFLFRPGRLHSVKLDVDFAIASEWVQMNVALSPRELAQWEEVDQSCIHAIPALADGPKLVAGCRVFLPLSRPSTSPFRSGIIVDTDVKGLCRVRVSYNSKLLNMLSSSLVDDLLSPIEDQHEDNDEIVVDIRHLRPHYLTGPAEIQPGGRVVILSGQHRGRVGIVERIQSAWRPAVLTITDNQVAITNVPVCHVARLFFPGDPVVVNYGLHRGKRGTIQSTFALKHLEDGLQQFPPGGAQVLVDQVVDVPTQFLLFDIPAMNFVIRTPVNVEEHWLGRPGLVGKRLDVRVLPIQRGRISATQARAVGKEGFIILSTPVTANNFDVALDVELDSKPWQVRIRPEWLQPILDIPGDFQGQWPVVVIGKDVQGRDDFMGKYATIDAGGYGTWPVQLVISGARAWFPRGSLCRASHINLPFAAWSPLGTAGYKQLP